MNPLSGARILIGVTGGIAAYKSVLLIRELQKAGAHVRAMATPAATRFIGIETLKAITRETVPVEVFSDDPSSDWTRHIQWGEWADLILIAPCTANTLAKLANGLSDSMLTSTVLAAAKPVILCPTMDGDMYHHPATRRNLQDLSSYGYHILEPETGYLASGQEGTGRLPEANVILEVAREVLNARSRPTQTTYLKGRRVLVTAGPTREYIDAVRFISNPSTGKMGFAMAMAARDAGAEVELLHGPVEIAPPSGVRSTGFTSAYDLNTLVQQKADNADIVIMAAAVSDSMPSTRAARKLHKEELDDALQLKRTPDILAWLSDHRQKAQRKTPFLLGFAMETDEVMESATRKLHKKGLDAILVNELREGVSGFATDRNELTLLRPDTDPIRYEGSKREIAAQILRELFSEKQSPSKVD